MYAIAALKKVGSPVRGLVTGAGYCPCSSMHSSIFRSCLRATDRLGVPLLVSTRHPRCVPRISKFGVLPERGGLSLSGTLSPPAERTRSEQYRFDGKSYPGPRV